MKDLIRTTIALLLLIAPEAARGAEPVVIVNKSNPVSGISAAQMKKLLLGQQTKWKSGAEVSVLLGPSGQPERKSVLHRFCGMDESAFTAWFLHATFKGESLVVPKSMPSSQSIVQIVQLVPGAIGVVSSADVTSQVKVLSLSESVE